MTIEEALTVVTKKVSKVTGNDYPKAEMQLLLDQKTESQERIFSIVQAWLQTPEEPKETDITLLMYLLVEMKEARLFPLWLSFLGNSGQVLEEAFGEEFIDVSVVLFFRLYKEGAETELFEYIQNQQNDSWARASVCDALEYLTASHKIPNSTLLAIYNQLLTVESNEIMATYLAEFLTEYGNTESKEIVKKAIQENRVDFPFPEQKTAMFNRLATPPSKNLLFEDRSQRITALTRGAIAQTEGWYCYQQPKKRSTGKKTGHQLAYSQKKRKKKRK